ncbi:MAG: FAD:protein FMN transferase [Atopobiaceae bacterium]
MPILTTRQFFAFDTQCTIAIAHERAAELIDLCQQHCHNFEHLLSHTNPASLVWAINTSAPFERIAVSDDFADALKASLSFCEKTHGLCDIGLGKLYALWNWHNAHVPSKEAIEAARKDAGWRRIHVLDGEVWRENRATEVTLGSTAKGWIADRLRDDLVDAGVTSAFINLGGNISLIGNDPDDLPWRISLAHPTTRKILGTLHTHDCAIVTSGIGERTFTSHNKHYHHIIDPRTGYPAQTDIASITLITPEGTDADGLSTALLIMGSEQAQKAIADLNETQAIIVLTDGSIITTAGLTFEAQTT